MSKNLVAGACLSGLALIATPALSDSCLPKQAEHHSHHHSYRTAERSREINSYSVRRSHRDYLEMDEPYYEEYDEGFPMHYWHARSGWWEWHPHYRDERYYRDYDYDWRPYGYRW
ncbi:MAG: hypothetical protein JOZ55_03015 [Alphaproteobacteria bacterium]|nr:hypothetical protein [Alphaproteobacteria bacterium]